MPKPRVTLTEEEIQERKQRWWGPERNARRRERYANDPNYRERVIEGVKRTYRQQRDDAGLPSRYGDCRENVQHLPDIGMVREVRVDEEQTVRRLTFTIPELARALDRNPQVLYRWIEAELLPAPAYEARNIRGRWQRIYTVGEVRALLGVFGQHQEHSQYLKKHHVETINGMKNAVEAIRRQAQG